MTIVFIAYVDDKIKQKRIKKYALSNENTLVLIWPWNRDNKLPLVLINPEVVVHKVASAKIFHKLFIMSDDYKLKVPLELPGSYNSEKKSRHRGPEISAFPLKYGLSENTGYTNGSPGAVDVNDERLESASLVFRQRFVGSSRS